MTDRELLEAAARAIGLYADGYRAQFRDGEGWLCIRPADEKCMFQCIWAPLTDDGDALRLAVRLHLWIGIDAHAIYVANDDFEVASISDSESHGDDALAATRRAIVRAAAAIARKSDE